MESGVDTALWHTTMISILSHHYEFTEKGRLQPTGVSLQTINRDE